MTTQPLPEGCHVFQYETDRDSFQQFLASLDNELSLGGRQPHARLTAAHADAVFTWRDNAIPGFVDKAQITRTKLEMHTSGLTRSQLHTNESAQRAYRSSRYLGKAKIKFDDFVSVAVARVSHVYIHIEQVTRGQF